jgi:ribosomal protein L11 methyltransferase
MYALTCEIDDNPDVIEIASAIGYGCGVRGCVEGAPGNGRVALILYFELERQALAAAAAFAEMLSGDNYSVEYVDDRQDWNAKWRESMEPAEVAPGVWVSPAWLEPPDEGREAWIKIEPKMAFGTGHHETTRLAAGALIELGDSATGKSVLDIGTGSGVLCFVASHLGAREAIGVEIDADCRENLAENLRDNPPQAGGAVKFVIGTLDSIRADRHFDVAVMNMLSTESIPLLGQVAAITRNGSILIWSGILANESEAVINAAKSFGFGLRSVGVENEWWRGTFAR